ncbi:MAG: proline dehydrogenase family protein, partial [Cryobacterium sp.]|nr:proline dehydrogenase family protein [Cryobacterium sp.]
MHATGHVGAGHADDRTLEVASAQLRAANPDTVGTAPIDPSGAVDWERAVSGWLAAHDANDFLAGDDEGSRARVRLLGLLDQPGGLEFLVALADDVMRPDSDRAAASSVSRLSHALGRDGEFEQLRVPFRVYFELALGAGFAPVLPSVGAWFGRRVVRHYLNPLVVSFDEGFEKRWLEYGAIGGLRPIAAPVGVRAIGNRQADLQLALVEQLVAETGAASVALSLSAVARLGNGGLGSAARERIVSREVERLAHLAQLARSTETQLIFEVDQYRDLDLTLAIVLRLLDRPENERLSAALTLPLEYAESFAALQRLVTWAEDRRARGGAPLTIRLAHADELVDEGDTARLHRWQPRALADPAVVFGNLQRMLDWALSPARLVGVRIVLASYLVHEHAFAWRLARMRGALRSLEHEFRHGVAPAAAAAVKRSVGGIRLRVAVVTPYAKARAADYVVRRLRELHGRLGTSGLPDAVPVPSEGPRDHGLRRVTDADPVSPEGREWFDAVADRVRELVRAGASSAHRSSVETTQQLSEQLERAAAAAPAWAERRPETRAIVLRSVAEAFAYARTELVAAAMAESGVTVCDADHEVTQTIDLALSLAESAEQLSRVSNAEFAPVPLILALAPRTSPIATPAAGALTAIAAGSAVAVKPAPQNRRSVAAVVATIVDGGVPGELVVLLPPLENDEVRDLVEHPFIERVLLTGSRHVAKRVRVWRPEIPLLATTGGRNSIIVSDSADVDRAVADLVISAFHNAGQSPESAGTVLVVGEHERFVSLLTDAVASLATEPPQGLTTAVGALSRAAERGVRTSLTELAEGESWLVQPRQLDDGGRLWTPGLVHGVQPGGARHVAERRGPVLSLIHVDTFDEALDLQNGIGFGLTAGLQSADLDEIARWLDSAQAGGLAVNRPVTGALPSRHPLVGWNRSSIGITRAPGGRLQLDELGTWRPRNPQPDESVDLA